MDTTYHTTVTWTGDHRGEVRMGNGPLLPFSAPPEAHGEPGVLTPEDTFVAAVNTCIMLMFLWACERFKIDLVSYDCRAEGTKHIELDRTETFTRVALRPKIVVCAGGQEHAVVEKRVRRALDSARKYSLVANSIRSEVAVEAEIEIRESFETLEVNTVSIKVLGPGCMNCQTVAQIARDAVEALGVEATLVKVTDRAEFKQYGLLATPGLVINEKLVCGGRIPTPEEVMGWLQEAGDKKQ